MPASGKVFAKLWPFFFLQGRWSCCQFYCDRWRGRSSVVRLRAKTKIKDTKIWSICFSTTNWTISSIRDDCSWSGMDSRARLCLTFCRPVLMQVGAWGICFFSAACCHSDSFRRTATGAWIVNCGKKPSYSNVILSNNGKRNYNRSVNIARENISSTRACFRGRRNHRTANRKHSYLLLCDECGEHLEC